MAAAAGARAQVGEGALENVQGAEGVCGELGADFVVVLVFAGAYYSCREWGVSVSGIGRTEWSMMG